MNLSTLNEWLSWIATLHAKEIDLSLDRVKEVAAKLGILSPSCPVIIIGGTNGKGSTVAGLEAIYLAAGYQVGAFTTPFLFKYNEQVRINGKSPEDEAFCEAFTEIEAIRDNISLTPFEFSTLAALWIFKKHRLDVLLLEVGLGGRLDAVNIIDADASVITSIAIDHTEWLGSTREAIAAEKAGIFRSERPVICGDPEPPKTLSAMAEKLAAPFYCQGKDFHYTAHATDWDWQSNLTKLEKLPLPQLALQNISTVLMTITLLQEKLPVERSAIDLGLQTVKLPGRLETFPGPVTKIFDVSHNPAAMRFLKDYLTKQTHSGKTYAVFSMLGDKDIAQSIGIIKEIIDVWLVAPLQNKRAATMPQLWEAFAVNHLDNVSFYASVIEAYQAAKNLAVPGDRIIIFGSFHTVAEASVTV